MEKECMFYLYFILTNKIKCLKYRGRTFRNQSDLKRKSSPMQRQTRSPYADLIAKATGAADDLLPILEKIMREDVFHSTLDWQSASQFRSGARKALAIYEEYPDFFQAEMSHQLARFQMLMAEQVLSDLTSQSGSPEAITLAEAAYRTAMADEQIACAAFDRELVTL
jgi:hypothetical protein